MYSCGKLSLPNGCCVGGYGILPFHQQMVGTVGMAGENVGKATSVGCPDADPSLLDPVRTDRHGVGTPVKITQPIISSERRGQWEHLGWHHTLRKIQSFGGPDNVPETFGFWRTETVPETFGFKNSLGADILFLKP
jgi:hypothetical protein